MLYVPVATLITERLQAERAKASSKVTGSN